VQVAARTKGKEHRDISSTILQLFYQWLIEYRLVIIGDGAKNICDHSRLIMIEDIPIGKCRFALILYFLG